MVVGIEELDIVTESNAEGVFVFENIDKGKYTLYFSHWEFGTQIIRIKAKRDFIIEKKFKKNVYEINDINIDRRDKPSSRSSRTVTRKDIKNNPGRWIGDSFQALKILPGVGGGFSLASVPIVRGMNPLFNKYYIDDMPVDYPFHFLAVLFPLFPSVNEESINEMELLTVNSPIWTGDNLGSIINIKTRTAEQTGIHGAILVDPAVPVFPTISFSMVPYKDLFVTGNIRRSDIDWMIDLEETDFSFQDYFFKIEYNFHNSHRFTLSGTGSKDRLNYEDFDTFSGFDILGLKWEFLIGKHFIVNTTASRYELNQYLQNKRLYSDRIGVRIDINPQEYRLSQILSFAYKLFYLNAGYETTKHMNGCKANVELSNIATINILDQTSFDILLEYPVTGLSRSFFIRTGFKAKQCWLNAGYKYEHYGPLSNISNSYTVDAGYNAGNRITLYAKNSLKYAHPDIIYYLGNSDPDFKDAEAMNWGLGSDIGILKNLFLNIELYYSKFENLSPDFFNVDNEIFKKLAQMHPFADESDGNTYGGEASLSWDWKFLSGKVNYSYSVSERNNDNDKGFVSDFDQTHILRFLVTGTWKKWNSTVIWHRYSSLPYTPIIGSVQSGSDYSAEYGNKNTARFKMHSRVDVKINYNFSKRSRIYLEYWNLFFKRDNTIFEYYDSGKPYAWNNPEKFNDLPAFVWLGVEVSL